MMSRTIIKSGNGSSNLLYNINNKSDVTLSLMLYRYEQWRIQNLLRERADHGEHRGVRAEPPRGPGVKHAWWSVSASFLAIFVQKGPKVKDLKAIALPAYEADWQTASGSRDQPSGAARCAHACIRQ